MVWISCTNVGGDMNRRRNTSLSVLSGIRIWSVLAFELTAHQGITAPACPPAVPSNANVVNVPGVHVINSPTVLVRQRNWKYRAELIPNALPGTPKMSESVARLN